MTTAVDANVWAVCRIPGDQHSEHAAEQSVNNVVQASADIRTLVACGRVAQHACMHVWSPQWRGGPQPGDGAGCCGGPVVTTVVYVTGYPPGSASAVSISSVCALAPGDSHGFETAVIILHAELSLGGGPVRCAWLSDRGFRMVYPFCMHLVACTWIRQYYYICTLQYTVVSTRVRCMLLHT